MPKLTKVSDKGRFSLFVQRAVENFDHLRAGAHWSSKGLDEIARSAVVKLDQTAGFDQKLSYDGVEVDPAIVKAIRIMADTTKSQAEGMQALEDAWKAYSEHP